MEDITEEFKRKRNGKSSPRWKNKISISANLPNDVCDIFAGSICMVKYSADPFLDMRESILEMIREAGIRDWYEMEELVYCYIALNSSDLHEIIEDAFLSLCHK
ncbi:Transcription repressor like [Quillaja saponaria]|uniref:Transcription repressor n=1 Tax=Quillaja saponaria TaxID=32244 RepID=A0AAD7LJT4_QUISA|nr:Transcription repressor like [Quillaja saponaria]